MDIASLEGTARQLFARGLATRTRSSYASAQRRYLEFCGAAQLPPLPPSEGVLCLFVVFLAQQGLAHQTITAYLSGVRNLEIARGGHPIDRDGMPRLQLVLRGIARTPSDRPQRPQRLPITGTIMHQLRRVWSGQDFESRLMWAATCVGYFGFLRAGEFTMVDPTAPPSITLEDVAVDSRTAPSALRLFLRRAKTDPFGKGVEIFLGSSGTEVCAVAALLSYMSVRPPARGHLFVWEDGRPLSRPVFVTRLRRGLELAGLEVGRYSGHSLRIGAATSAAAAGVPDHLIKMLGRWQSDAYQLYVRTPRDSLLGVARLIGGPQV